VANDKGWWEALGRSAWRWELVVVASHAALRKK